MQHKNTTEKPITTIEIDPSHIQTPEERRVLTALYYKYRFGHNRLYRFESGEENQRSDRYFVSLPEEDSSKIVTYKVHLTNDVIVRDNFYFFCS